MLLRMQTPFNFSLLFDKVSKALYEGNSGYLLNQTHKHLTKFGNMRARENKISYEKILEIGAGKGELYEHVDKNYNQYFMTDVSLWGEEEIKKISEIDSKVVFELQDIEKLEYPDNFFDRVLVTCVIAHVAEPFKSLEELRRVTKPQGTISIAVSTDPSILLRIIRRVLILRKMKNLNIPYELFIAIQHRNNPLGIMNMLNWIFRNDQIFKRYYPFRLKMWNLSTHIIVDIVKTN
jgi:phosphatidylethanolamine/phosphatidyl-N-methylethanolamine N-methyltransferase